MNWNETFDLMIAKLQGWLEAIIVGLPNIVAALVVVVLFALLARLARRLARRLMDRVSANLHVNRLLATTAYVIVLATGLFVALGILQLDKTVTTFLAGAGIVGLALGFAFQDIASNFISGVILSVRRPFDEGDVVETNDYMGTVHEVNLRSTVVRTFQNQLVVIPNKEVFQNPVVNYSRLGQRRVDIGVGVAYGDDLEKARQLNYTPTITGRGLATSQTFAIGFFVREKPGLSAQTDPFYGEILRGAEQTLAQSDYHLTLATLTPDILNTPDTFRFTRERRIDGMILAGLLFLPEPIPDQHF